ncbi:hypothetical protein WMF31_01075 [Sorangium sp. So ce1036]|uniref:hypothetical protein n=1 Tax=Sorangium sp. So ce1036 TaxID=3133328 RepID=UPI003F11CD7C
MLHRAASSAMFLVLLGALGAGCQGAKSGAPTATPAETGRGAEGGGAPSPADTGDGSDAPDTGGQPGCVDTPFLKYVGQGHDECARIRFVCEPGWIYFSDDCGCGCTKQP